jgi:predicted transposase YdaD
MDSNSNIFFLLEEKEHADTNVDLDQLLNEMNSNVDTNITNANSDITTNNDSLLYYIEKNVFSGEDEIYYNEKYTIKDLMKICNYYGIDKNIKSSKCKKQDIVSTIVFFEGQVENTELVNRRHNMWAYMTELTADPKMRMYLLWV